MPVDVDSLTTGQKVAAGAGLVTIIGAFLPWVDAGIVTVDGLSGDGIFTLIFGAVVVAIVLLRDWNRKEMIGTGVLGVLTILIAMMVYGNLEDQTNEAVVEATAGGGLHLTLIGGIGMAAAAAYGYYTQRTKEQQPRQPPQQQRNRGQNQHQRNRQRNKQQGNPQSHHNQEIDE